jgi:hypothetical protein
MTRVRRAVIAPARRAENATGDLMETLLETVLAIILLDYEYIKWVMLIKDRSMVHSAKIYAIRRCSLDQS